MLKRILRKYVKEAYMRGFNEGLATGRKLGIAEANGQAIITGAPLVDKQIEEIMEKSK